MLQWMYTSIQQGIPMPVTCIMICKELTCMPLYRACVFTIRYASRRRESKLQIDFLACNVRQGLQRSSNSTLQMYRRCVIHRHTPFPSIKATYLFYWLVYSSLNGMQGPCLQKAATAMSVY